MRKLIIVVAVVAAIAVSATAYYNYRQAAPEPEVTTATVVRGDIVDTVGATGTLQAVTTVQVGTQVSGTVSELNADFNSLVRKGQILARLDPSLFQTQIEQARANLVRSQADVERLRVSLEDARRKLARAEELAARSLIPRSELEAAQVAVSAAEAQIRSAEAQVIQAQASLNQNQVNLNHTVITSPIDGIVISRNVDVGQTVAASMQAPTLFVLAADLAKMQVIASLDESDVGRIRPGQQVRFRVDAYPAEDFAGNVAQVRLQPQVQQNVVTYSTVIEVPNPELKLKPGMTANVNIEIARRSDAIRVPNAALRFRPTPEIFAALGQSPVPADPQRPIETPRAADAPPAASPPAGRRGEFSQPLGEPAAGRSGDAAPEGGRGAGAAAEKQRAADGDRRALLLDRLQGMPPELRAQMLERMRARGFDPTAAPGPEGRPEPPAARAAKTDQQRPVPRDPAATTIDALFGPLPPVESTGRVWLYVDTQLRPVRVRLGITDGQATELLAGNLAPGAAVVTSVNTGEEARPAASGLGGFPFMPGGRVIGGARPAGGGQAPRR